MAHRNRNEAPTSINGSNFPNELLIYTHFFLEGFPTIEINIDVFLDACVARGLQAEFILFSIVELELEWSDALRLAIDKNLDS